MCVHHGDIVFKCTQHPCVLVSCCCSCYCLVIFCSCIHMSLKILVCVCWSCIRVKVKWRQDKTILRIDRYRCFASAILYKLVQRALLQCIIWYSHWMRVSLWKCFLQKRSGHTCAVLLHSIYEERLSDIPILH